MSPLPNSDEGALRQQVVQTMLSRRRLVYKLAASVVVVSFLGVTLFPFYWLGLLAVTPNRQIVEMGVLPRAFDLSSFVWIFSATEMPRYVFNSLFVATVTTAVVLVLGSLAGYAFGRFEFPGRKPAFVLVLVITYFPPAAFFVPLFQLLTGNVSFLGLTSPDLFNSPWAIVTPLSALTMPFAIYVLTVFYSQIPDGLEDAARIEGTTRLGALFRVIVPLSAPGVATAGVLTFIAVYNEFFFSFLMTDGRASSWAPIAGGFSSLGSNYSLAAAASIVGILPVAILVFVAQEYIVEGITTGALKE